MFSENGYEWVEPVIPGEIAIKVGLNPQMPLLEGDLGNLVSQLGDRVIRTIRFCKVH
jgi:hypothetical protein